MLSVFRHAKEEDLRQKMHSLESLGIYPKKNRESLQLLLKDCISECFGLQWVKQPGFSSEADKIKKTMKRIRSAPRDVTGISDASVNLDDYIYNPHSDD